MGTRKRPDRGAACEPMTRYLLGVVPLVELEPVPAVPELEPELLRVPDGLDELLGDVPLVDELGDELLEDEVSGVVLLIAEPETEPEALPLGVVVVLGVLLVS